jgi:hypothetical protein
MMNLTNLNSFLKFGYFLHYKNPLYSADFSGLDKNKYKNISELELIEIGSQLWMQAVEKQFSFNEKHIVPLSGGLDSRAILATLLEFTSAKNITTYTFGIPGSLDYDIGYEIADIIGTNHVQLNLKEYHYSIDKLLDISKRIDHQTLLFLHPDVTELDEKFNDGNIWSGTIIDVYFGRHFHKNKASNWKQAGLNSINENVFVKSMDLTCIDNEEYLSMIEYDDQYHGLLELEYVIDLMNRQLKFIAPHVLMKGFKYKTMLDNDLIAFAVSLEYKYIEHQYLYKKILSHRFEDIFQFRTKTNYGLPLNSSGLRLNSRKFRYRIQNKINNFLPIFTNPFINYLDFNYEILHNRNLRSIIHDSIMDLYKRKIVEWIDIEKIWKDHVDNKIDHSDALLVLASLEIHMKAGLLINGDIK